MEDLRAFIRKNHPISGALYIRKNFKRFNIESYPEAEIISKIVEAHSRSFDINKLPERWPITLKSGNIQIQLRFLGAILRLADSMDIAYGRVPIEHFRWKDIARKEPKQIVHWAYKMLISFCEANHESWTIDIYHNASGEWREYLKITEGYAVMRDLISVRKILKKYLMPFTHVVLQDPNGNIEELTDKEYEKISKKILKHNIQKNIKKHAKEIVDKICT